MNLLTNCLLSLFSARYTNFLVCFAAVFGQTLLLFGRLFFPGKLMESSCGHTRDDGWKLFIFQLLLDSLKLTPSSWNEITTPNNK
jgi:hypothetical protein